MSAPDLEQFVLAQDDRGTFELRQCCAAVLALEGSTAEQVFGSVDAMKLRSSMTLFARAAPDEFVFVEVLGRFFGGKADAATDELLA